MSIREIEKNIGDDILISKVRVEPGLSNQKEHNQSEIPSRVLGDNTENKIPSEGTITYDIRFSFWLPQSKEFMKLLLNVEAQKEHNPGYPLVTRGIFYVARMISAQLETEFIASNYQNIKKVYSIWICMNAPDYIGNALTRYNFGKTDVIGETPDYVGDYDKMNVSMIYLNQEKDQDDNSIFHFLNMLFSESYDVDEKIRVLEEKFEIGVEEKSSLMKELNTMCNLGEGLVERSEKKGETRMQDKLNKLTQTLLDTNRIDDLKRSTEDKEYQKQLMKEYGIS